MRMVKIKVFHFVQILLLLDVGTVGIIFVYVKVTEITVSSKNIPNHVQL